MSKGSDTGWRVSVPRGDGRLYLPRYRRRRDGARVESAVWWWQYRTIRVSTGCRDQRDARRWAMERLVEMGRGSTVGLRAQALRYEDLERMIVDRYRIEGRRSLPDLVGRLKHVRHHFGGWRALEITSDRIVGYAAKRREAGAAINTVNLELTFLRRMLSLAVEAGRLERRPVIHKLPGEHIRRDFIRDADLLRILEHMPPYVRPVVEFLRLTGWRVSEALALEWRRVDWEAQEIRLDTSKTGEPRILAWSTYPALAELLERQRTAQVGRILPWVFSGRSDRPIPERTIEAVWARARKAAGIIAAEGPFLHGLRRTLARELIDAGVSEIDAANIMGHKTLSMFRRYAIRDRASQEAALGRLTEHRGSCFTGRFLRADEKKA